MALTNLLFVLNKNNSVEKGFSLSLFLAGKGEIKKMWGVLYSVLKCGINWAGGQLQVSYGDSGMRG